jgi:hypothetical protein
MMTEADRGLISIMSKYKFAEQFFLQGREKGRQEGEAALLLLHLIEVKFSDPSDTVRQQVQTVEMETLLHWAERILFASRLEEVFDDLDQQ